MTNEELRTELLGIHGIGEAKADEIIGIVTEHTSDNAGVRGLLEDALAYHEQGDSSYGYKFVRQALNEL